MILNLWSEGQEGHVRIYGVGPRECSENIQQHCMYFALTVCVLHRCKKRFLRFLLLFFYKKRVFGTFLFSSGENFTLLNLLKSY